MRCLMLFGLCFFLMNCLALSQSYLFTVYDSEGTHTWAIEDIDSLTFADIDKAPGTALALYMKDGQTLLRPLPAIRKIQFGSFNGAFMDIFNYREAAERFYLDDIAAIGFGGSVTGISYSEKPGMPLFATPNPFGDETWIRLPVTTDNPVEITIVNMMGLTVRTLDIKDNENSTKIRWDGKDDGGRLLPSGVYLARVNSAYSSTSVALIISR